MAIGGRHRAQDDIILVADERHACRCFHLSRDLVNRYICPPILPGQALGVRKDLGNRSGKDKRFQVAIGLGVSGSPILKRFYSRKIVGAQGQVMERRRIGQAGRDIMNCRYSARGTRARHDIACIAGRKHKSDQSGAPVMRFVPEIQNPAGQPGKYTGKRNQRPADHSIQPGDLGHEIVTCKHQPR